MATCALFNPTSHLLLTNLLPGHTAEVTSTLPDTQRLTTQLPSHTGATTPALTHAQASPHRCSKKPRTSSRSTFLSMLATYTVRLQRSSSWGERGMSSLLTGTMAVLLGSTRSGDLPRMRPVSDTACGMGPGRVGQVSSQGSVRLCGPAVVCGTWWCIAKHTHHETNQA
jgi:hypothetical protein